MKSCRGYPELRAITVLVKMKENLFNSNGKLMALVSSACIVFSAQLAQAFFQTAHAETNILEDQAALIKNAKDSSDFRKLAEMFEAPYDLQYFDPVLTGPTQKLLQTIWMTENLEQRYRNYHKIASLSKRDLISLIKKNFKITKSQDAVILSAKGLGGSIHPSLSTNQNYSYANDKGSLGFEIRISPTGDVYSNILFVYAGQTPLNPQKLSIETDDCVYKIEFPDGGNGFIAQDKNLWIYEFSMDYNKMQMLYLQSNVIKHVNEKSVLVVQGGMSLQIYKLTSKILSNLAESTLINDVIRDRSLGRWLYTTFMKK